MDKYEIGFPEKARELNKQRLINQLWKLIPMREHDEDWYGHLAVLIEEISGLVEIYRDNADGLILLSKLEGLTSDICADFMLYRKTVFRCIDLLASVLTNE